MCLILLAVINALIAFTLRAMQNTHKLFWSSCLARLGRETKMGVFYDLCRKLKKGIQKNN